MGYTARKFIFAVITFTFTVFVFINTYEVLFNKDIIFAASIQKAAAQQTLNSAVKEFEVKNLTDETDASASLTDMDHLEIPALDIRLHTEESRKIGSLWYERPGAMHYIGLNKNQHGATIDYLLYGAQSWRTITEPDQIEKGMEVDVYYGGKSVSTFTVADKKALPIGQSLLVDKSDARQILLIIENPKDAMYYGYSLELKK
jgi:hypothetical protein